MATIPMDSLSHPAGTSADTLGADASRASSSPTPAADAPPPSDTSKLRKKFHDFDQAQVFQAIRKQCRDEHAKNFVVHFGADQAKVATNLDTADIAALMTKRHLFDRDEAPVRWINLWNLQDQADTIEAIGKHYRFSRRLIFSIQSWDKAKTQLRLLKASAKARAAREAALRASIRQRLSRTDLEGGAGESPSGRERTSAAPGAGCFNQKNLATFAVMQNTIDYTSMDFGEKFMCFGANWLHESPNKDKETLVPPKHWSWFALCDDNTILSFHEAYYESFSKQEGADHADWRDVELGNIRANTLKVFFQLSQQGQKEDRDIMQLTSVRESMATATGDKGREGACSVFYYLFEDYSAALLIIKDTKDALEKISRRVLRTADRKHKESTTDIIPQLYELNKELRQLRHLFTNYHTLISKILHRDPDETGPMVVSLAYSALNRFKRLQVQLQSLMLDTIGDYLDEKDALQNTYFNLTNQKDSQATERLTRSATVLAKLSVFFLPISFMTSYFSVQISDLTQGYTRWSYWGSFAVIAGVSFLCIFFFGKVLMFFSDWLDHAADRVERWVKHRLGHVSAELEGDE